jgi:uncharacterized protein YndB with AHSA1/START domain
VASTGESRPVSSFGESGLPHGKPQFEYELVDAGERVVWLIDLRMRGRSTGIEVPLGKHAFVSTFRDGLMVHSKLYMSQSEALEAVGLSEQEAPAQPSELALHMKRVLPASRPLVFNALTEPDELAKWWGPSGFTAPSVEVDLRAGGSYRIAMQPPDDELFFLSGEFLEVDPPARVAYTFRWEDPDPDDQETVVTLSLGDLGESTELVFTQRAFATEGRRALHEQGWTDGLNRLQELMSSAESGAASAS